LIAFVRKRDPRYKEYQDSQKAKKDAQLAENKARALRERQELQAKAAAYKEQEWARAAEESDSASESDYDDDTAYFGDDFYCVACNKYFKSQRQFGNHEQSKKHIKVVQELREQMLADEEDLDLQAIPLQPDEDEIEEPLAEEPVPDVVEVKEEFEEEPLDAESLTDDIPLHPSPKKSKKKGKKKAPKWGFDGEVISESATPNIDQELEKDDLSTLAARLELEQSGRRKKGSRINTPKQLDSDDEAVSQAGLPKTDDGVNSAIGSNSEASPVKESAKAKREKRKEKKKQKEEASAGVR
jgi:DnaJ family protein A protein 5